MAKFAKKNNYFKFLSSAFQQILGATIGTKFVSPCA